MITDEMIVEGAIGTVRYWSGLEILETKGELSRFSNELTKEPYTRFDGVIIESTTNGYRPFPVAVWVPFGNIQSLTYT